mmetsp:Transcript_14999/g.34130  ORF Transcript_14999/g.34130 Transcript_14999/m.34130 type:complete len:257 (-) Transcript_14999:1434-2204(-)
MQARSNFLLGLVLFHVVEKLRGVDQTHFNIFFGVIRSETNLTGDTHTGDGVVSRDHCDHNTCTPNDFNILGNVFSGRILNGQTTQKDKVLTKITNFVFDNLLGQFFHGLDGHANDTVPLFGPNFNRSHGAFFVEFLERIALKIAQVRRHGRHARRPRQDPIGSDLDEILFPLQGNGNSCHFGFGRCRFEMHSLQDILHVFWHGVFTGVAGRIGSYLILCFGGQETNLICQSHVFRLGIGILRTNKVLGQSNVTLLR